MGASSKGKSPNDILPILTIHLPDCKVTQTFLKAAGESKSQKAGDRRTRVGFSFSFLLPGKKCKAGRACNKKAALLPPLCSLPYLKTYSK